MSAAAPPRKDRLIGQVRRALQQMSGTNLEGVDPSVPFLEIGLDSLLLTQVGTKLQRDFGVRVSFRQLMEELSSLDAVAGYLDAALPREPEPGQAITALPGATAAPPQPALPSAPAAQDWARVNSRWSASTLSTCGSCDHPVRGGRFRDSSSPPRVLVEKNRSPQATGLQALQARWRSTSTWGR